ncbi:SDR family NAD(P)-dependent oxidoreductase [Streptomyces sp. NPDC098789]|uniref:SDR family NAD(P)-dependent oxidoreductase n=1 Tax=Streptomyces sp. NPDC098789 TaxID=3366098 RepID=UPI00382CF104
MTFDTNEAVSGTAGPLAVVSGGTRGIGLALSLRLAHLGHRVAALYRADHRSAREAAALGAGRIETHQVDMTRPDQVRAVSERLLAEHGAPDVLVNNAGINRDRPFLELSDEDWDQVLATNLSGPFHLTRALAPAMVKAGRGAIVNVGATTGIRPRANGVNYCASKAGLLHFTRCLALELAPAVRVNSLVPGFTDTPEVVERYGLAEPERRARVLGEIPLRTLGTVEDVADALEYLVGRPGRYVTGQQLIVDGGNFMG